MAEFVGAGGSYSHRDGPGAEARFRWPTGLAVDGGAGFMLRFSPTIRRVDPDGTVTTIVGRRDQFGDRDGPASRVVEFAPCPCAGTPQATSSSPTKEPTTETLRGGEVTTVAECPESGKRQWSRVAVALHLPRDWPSDPTDSSTLPTRGTGRSGAWTLWGGHPFAANVGSAQKDWSSMRMEIHRGRLERVDSSANLRWRGRHTSRDLNRGYADPDGRRPGSRRKPLHLRHSGMSVSGSGDGWSVSTVAGVQAPGEDGLFSEARSPGPRVAFALMSAVGGGH